MKRRRDNKLTDKRVPFMHPSEIPVVVLLESKESRDAKRNVCHSNIMVLRYIKDDARACYLMSWS